MINIDLSKSDGKYALIDLAQIITNNPSCGDVCKVARSSGIISDYLNKMGIITYDEYNKARKNIINDLEKLVPEWETVEIIPPNNDFGKNLVLILSCSNRFLIRGDDIDYIVRSIRSGKNEIVTIETSSNDVKTPKIPDTPKPPRTRKTKKEIITNEVKKELDWWVYNSTKLSQSKVSDRFASIEKYNTSVGVVFVNPNDYKDNQFLQVKKLWGADIHTDPEIQSGYMRFCSTDNNHNVLSEVRLYYHEAKLPFGTLFVTN